MPCDGGVGDCIGCGDTACLNEAGFCSSYCEEQAEEEEVSA
jgi:hypothetical protein